jgi:hypothetical protein
LPALLGAVLALLFAKSFSPHFVLFSNDGPLGLMAATENQFPARFSGTWRPLGWLGGEAPAAAVTVSNLLLTVCSPVCYLKFYAPFALLFTGFCAWLFFRQLRFNGLACVGGGLAAALNMHFFSVACWGQGTWDISAGMTFLALAIISTPAIRQLWVRGVLAGLAVGMAVMEGFDVGAILSVFVGVFVLFHGLTEQGSVGRRLARVFALESLVVCFAAFIAVHTVSTLVFTQVEGISGNKQDEQTKEGRWIPNTRWSLPKLETLQILIPGVFGYRTGQHIDTPDHSYAYWGSIGEDPKIPQLESSDSKEREKALVELNVPEDIRRAVMEGDTVSRRSAIERVLQLSGATRRFTGTGEYAGVLVTLLAIFGLTTAFRREGSGLTAPERKAVWYWGAAALFCLAAAWGRYSFVYALLYRLPYFSTIRNPIKFLHPFQIAWVILAAYGLESLCRRNLKAGVQRTEFVLIHVAQWWKKSAGFEKKWVTALGLLVGAAAVGVMIYGAARNDLTHHLEKVGFAPQNAAIVAGFSFTEALWFVVILSLSALALAGMLSGAWTGAAMRWAGVYLGVILIFDLARADSYWVHYIDADEKLALNPVTEYLGDKPYEHRVIGRLEPFGPGSGIMPGIGQLYYVWLQSDFPYHNIQSLDFAQMPRVPDRDRAYAKALQLTGTELERTDLFPATRMWELTNTRFIVGPASTVELVNDRVPEAQRSLHVVSLLNIVRKPSARQMVDYSDSTVVTSDKGAYALLEYDEALPRAKLYADWKTPPNDATVLSNLVSRDFHPDHEVMISDDTPIAHAPTDPKADPGTVRITDYQPKHIALAADVKSPAVLLLNDRIAPDWKVYVDGQSNPVLRCNYIMRGVYLTPGQHTVDFRFQPPIRTLYFNIAALCVGLLVSGFAFATNRPGKNPAAVIAAEPVPAPPPAPPPSAKSPREKPSNRQKARR